MVRIVAMVGCVLCCLMVHGMTNEVLLTCGEIFQKDIADGVIHGAAVVAGGVDGTEIRGEWGWADPAHTVPMTTRTVIDVASVTKAAGVTALLVEHARGEIDFDAPFTNYLASYRAPLDRRITVRELANHRSGFGEADGPGPRVYFSTNAKTMMSRVLSLPPGIPQTDKVVYSCRNYVLLGQLLESVTGRSVADYCQNEIFEPLGMTDTSIGAPLPSIERNRRAQTFGTTSPGAISDFVARPLWAAGYSTVNAGLFSTAEDLARLMRTYLRGGISDNGHRIFGAAEMAAIAPSATNHMDGARSFGWLSFEQECDDRLIGTALWHSGWSGQTVMFDVKRQRYAIVLTTRCGDYCRAKRERFQAIVELLLGW